MVGREIVWEVGRPHGAQEGVLPSSEEEVLPSPEEEAHRPLKFPPFQGAVVGRCYSQVVTATVPQPGSLTSSAPPNAVAGFPPATQ